MSRPKGGTCRPNSSNYLRSWVFKIIKTDLSSPFLPGSMDFDETDNELLMQYCVTERWTGELSNGLFSLGEKAALAHGLPQRTCGLLNLIRCYEPLDRTCSSSSSRQPPPRRRSVFPRRSISMARRASRCSASANRQASRKNTPVRSSAFSSSHASRSTWPAGASSASSHAGSARRALQAASLVLEPSRIPSTGIGRPRK